MEGQHLDTNMKHHKSKWLARYEETEKSSGEKEEQTGSTGSEQIQSYSAPTEQTMDKRESKDLKITGVVDEQKNKKKENISKVILKIQRKSFGSNVQYQIKRGDPNSSKATGAHAEEKQKDEAKTSKKEVIKKSSTGEAKIEGAAGPTDGEILSNEADQKTTAKTTEHPSDVYKTTLLKELLASSDEGVNDSILIKAEHALLTGEDFDWMDFDFIEHGNRMFRKSLHNKYFEIRKAIEVSEKGDLAGPEDDSYKPFLFTSKKEGKPKIDMNDENVKRKLNWLVTAPLQFLNVLGRMQNPHLQEPPPIQTAEIEEVPLTQTPEILDPPVNQTAHSHEPLLPDNTQKESCFEIIPGILRPIPIYPPIKPIGSFIRYSTSNVVTNNTNESANPAPARMQPPLPLGCLTPALPTSDFVFAVPTAPAPRKRTSSIPNAVVPPKVPNMGPNGINPDAPSTSTGIYH